MHCSTLLILFTIFGSAFSTIISQAMKKENRTSLCGTIIDIPLSRKSLKACSLACVHQDTCKGILFAKDKDVSKICKLITSQSETITTSSALSGYTPYFPRLHCPGYGNNETFELPENWNSGCPVAYFPLDASTEGVAYGNDPTAIDFSQPGKVGNGLSFVNPTGSLDAAFRLHGTFLSPQYCYTTPDSCTQGM